MKMYAILNERNICVMLSSTKDGYRNFVETNMDVLGKQYIDGEWVDAQSEPTQLDRIEEQLNALSAESVTVEKLEAAITEGVKEV